MSTRQKDSVAINALRAFVAISEHGSFTKAAEQLNLTQPGVSLQIKQLESVVGGELFVKKKAGVALTGLGIAVDRLARRMLSINDQLIGIAGRAPQHETIHLGIQCIFAQTVLPHVVRECRLLNNFLYKFVCEQTAALAEKQRSGFVDVAVMVVPNETRRNLLVRWTEKFVWVRAPHQTPMTKDGTIPFIARQEGTMDRRALDALDERDIPYRIVLNASDLGSMIAAVEAGVGFMPMPERTVPASLIVARDRHLPKLPDLNVGVFCTEGFDLARHRALVDAFISAVRPANPNPPAKPRTQRPSRPRQVQPEGLSSP